MNVLNNSWQFIQQYRVTFILSIVITTVFFVIGAVPETLYYNQEAISKGEVWRFFTAHIVHSDVQHLIWNLCALFILSLLIEQHNRLMLLLSLFVGVVAIDYYLWFNSMGIINYAGFSGVLNTLLVVALFQPLQNNKDQNNKSRTINNHHLWLVIIIYLTSLLKIVFEIVSQQAIFSDISWQAVPQVHLIGFIAGTVLICLPFNRPNFRHSNG